MLLNESDLKTIADIVAMFIPRESPQQEEPTGHQHL